MKVDRRRFLAASATGLVGIYMPTCYSKNDESEILRRLRIVLTFSNPHARTLIQQRFWCYLPVSSTATQRLRDVRVSAPHRLLDDVLGHCILELSFDQVPPWAQKIITVTADVDLNVSPREETLPDTISWLITERYIEVDDPLIRSLAQGIKQTAAISTARAIYDWVANNLIYSEYIIEDKGAVQTLLQRRGDCTEYAYLVVALARACGIPARMLGGFVIDRNTALRPEEYHNWAELYFDGAWRLVDAQKKQWLAHTDQYVAFHIYRDRNINPIGYAHRYSINGDLTVKF